MISIQSGAVIAKLLFPVVGPAGVTTLRGGFPALPYSLEMFSLQRLPREVFGILMSLEPAIAALAALAVLGERLSPIQWLAVACVIAASVGVTATRRRAPEAR